MGAEGGLTPPLSRNNVPQQGNPCNAVRAPPSQVRGCRTSHARRARSSAPRCTLSLLFLGLLPGSPTPILSIQLCSVTPPGPTPKDLYGDRQGPEPGRWDRALGSRHLLRYLASSPCMAAATTAWGGWGYPREQFPETVATLPRPPKAMTVLRPARRGGGGAAVTTVRPPAPPTAPTAQNAGAAGTRPETPRQPRLKAHAPAPPLRRRRLSRRCGTLGRT